MNKIFNTISIYIIGLLIIGVTGTYLSDYLNEVNWFGDVKTGETKCFATGEHSHYNYGSKSFINKDGVCLYVYNSIEQWGARHYWYNFGVVILFVLSLARGLVKTIETVDKYLEIIKNKEP